MTWCEMYKQVTENQTLPRYRESVTKANESNVDGEKAARAGRPDDGAFRQCPRGPREHSRTSEPMRMLRFDLEKKWMVIELD